MLAISCYYWNDGDRRRDYSYNHDHVRILKNMVERNVTIPHKFVCVTDDNIDGVETLPLDWTKHVPGTCFIRLMQRRPDYGEMIGADRVLNLDIDMVLVDNLDSLIKRPEPSVWWRNPNWPKPGRAFYQTSIQLFTPGHHSKLYTEFDPKTSPAFANRRFGGAEQAWVSEMLEWDEPYWDHFDGIYGAGRLNDNGIYTTLPEDAKIVSFPGNREPSQPEVQAKHPWIGALYR